MNGTNDKRWFEKRDAFVVRTFGRHRYGGDWVVLDAATGKVMTQAREPWSACRWVAHVLRTGHDWSGRQVLYGETASTPTTRDNVEDLFARLLTTTEEGCEYAA